MILKDVSLRPGRSREKIESETQRQSACKMALPPPERSTVPRKLKVSVLCLKAAAPHKPHFPPGVLTAFADIA